MKSAKFFIAFAFLLAFVIGGAGQKKQSSKRLDNLDLMNMNRQSANTESGIVTPNELEGLEFFKSGRLSNIKIGVSTRKDIQQIFGSVCEKPCDYDSNWIITFDYFGENQVLVEERRDQKSNRLIHTNYIPKKEVIGKIESVSLRPKKRISFDDFTLSDKFKRYSYLETGYSNSTNKDGVLIDFYIDSYGLQYLFFDKFTSDTFKDTFDLRKQFGNFRKGDLITVRYAIPKELERNYFVEDN